MSIRSLFQNRRWLALASIVLVVIIYLGWNVGASSADIAFYEVSRDEFIVNIHVKGELKALDSQSVSTPRNVRSSVQIVRLAPEGSIVKKGDFLVQFDPTTATQNLNEKQNALANAEAEYKSQMASAESNMAQLNSGLLTQRYSHEQAKLRFEQMKYEAETNRRVQEINLRKAELALTQAEEKIESQKKINKAKLQKATLQIDRARLQLEKAQRDLDMLTLVAPIDGLVVYMEIWGPSGRAKIKVGDSPWRGQKLVEIPDLSKMQVKTSINEVDVSRVAKGQQVRIKLDALPGPEFYGTIASIATLASRKRNSSVKEFKVEVDVDGSDPRLKPGMSAALEIITDKMEDEIFVPIEAVFEKDGKTIVYLAKSFKAIEVELGPKNANHVVVKTGLEVGQKVCLRDPTRPLEDIGTAEPQKINKKSGKKSSGNSEMIIIG